MDMVSSYRYRHRCASIFFLYCYLAAQCTMCKKYHVYVKEKCMPVYVCLMFILPYFVVISEITCGITHFLRFATQLLNSGADVASQQQQHHYHQRVCWRTCVCVCVMYAARLGWCTWWPHINRMQKKKHEKQNKYMIVKSELDRQRRRPRQRHLTTHFYYRLYFSITHTLPLHRRTEEKTCRCRGKHLHAASHSIFLSLFRLLPQSASRH